MNGLEEILLIVSMLPLSLLSKVYKEGRAEPEFRKIDALHQRCLNAERMKDDMSLTLQNTQKKLKKMDME